MTPPVYASNENVRFNETLDSCIVVDAGPPKKLIVWEGLTDPQQIQLDALVQAVGGVLPVVAFAGSQTINFDGTVVGGNATGLSNSTTQAGYDVVDLGGATLGADPTGLSNDATIYTASVEIDYLPRNISVVGSAAQTYTTLINEINADLGSLGTAALDGGNLKITSATTGVSSSVIIGNMGTLLPALTAFVAVLAPVKGTAAVTYTTNIVVDGVNVPVSVVGSAAQTFTDLITELNTDLGITATAAIVGGNIKITSATTGAGSTVLVEDVSLFRHLNGMKSFDIPLNGADGLLETMQLNYTSNGNTYYELFISHILTVGSSPPIPPFADVTDSQAYWNGTTWVRLIDDAVIP